TVNRAILNRLRPMALGHVPLQDLLSEMVRERARANPQIALTFAADKITPSYGDSIDLTIYRCTQEALTNAVRHAQPRHIDVALGEGPADDTPDGGMALKLIVRDDGRGMDQAAPKGYGITGMQERVQALGGTCVLDSAPGGGTCMRIAVPLDRG